MIYLALYILVINILTIILINKYMKYIHGDKVNNIHIKLYNVTYYLPLIIFIILSLIYNPLFLLIYAFIKISFFMIYINHYKEDLDSNDPKSLFRYNISKSMINICLFLSFIIYN